MYRDSDYTWFSILSGVANILGVVALALIVLYQFFEPNPNHRWFAVGCLALSVILKIQLYLQKIEIIEMRVGELVRPRSGQKRRDPGAGNLELAAYLLVFWIALFIGLFSFLPFTFWRSLF